MFTVILFFPLEASVHPDEPMRIDIDEDLIQKYGFPLKTLEAFKEINSKMGTTNNEVRNDVVSSFASPAFKSRGMIQKV